MLWHNPQRYQLSTGTLQPQINHRIFSDPGAAVLLCRGVAPGTKGTASVGAAAATTIGRTCAQARSRLDCGTYGTAGDYKFSWYVIMVDLFGTNMCTVHAPVHFSVYCYTHCSCHHGMPMPCAVGCIVQTREARWSLAIRISTAMVAFFDPVSCRSVMTCKIDFQKSTHPDPR